MLQLVAHIEITLCFPKFMCHFQSKLAFVLVQKLSGFCFVQKLSSCVCGGADAILSLCSKWQEYFIRQKGGCILDSESERKRLLQALVAAIERRVSHVWLLQNSCYHHLICQFNINEMDYITGIEVGTLRFKSSRIVIRYHTGIS